MKCSICAKPLTFLDIIDPDSDCQICSDCAYRLEQEERHYGEYREYQDGE